MANYGRQGSNLAQFMREQLNTVQPNEPEEEIRFDDLDVFTNTEFYDFDTHMRTDFKPSSDSPPTSKSESTSATSVMGGEFGTMDMINSGRSHLVFLSSYSFSILSFYCRLRVGACHLCLFCPCVFFITPGSCRLRTTRRQLPLQQILGAFPSPCLISPRLRRRRRR